MTESCADCGVTSRPEDHVVMIVQSVTFGGKAFRWQVCSRCFLKRGKQDQSEMREQLERSMKKAKVA